MSAVVNLEGMKPSLINVEIVKVRYMEGSKKAVKLNNRIYVSPEIYDLLLKEDGISLRTLLANIPLIDMGIFSPFGMMDEMTTQPPSISELDQTLRRLEKELS